MINLTEQAKDYLSTMVDSYEKKNAYLSVNGGGCSGFTYKWDMVDNDENGTVIDDLLVLDQMAEMFLMACTVDYVKELVGSYLKLINPNAIFVVEDNDVTKITWSAGTTPISQSDINAKLSEADALDSEKFTKKQTNRTNAIAKLKALGLTEDEINHLILTA